MLPGVPNTLEALHRRRDGSTFPVQVRLGMFRWGERPLFLALARDVSRRGALERDRLRSRKMEAIGRLVGGIAHDFNNMLTPIISYADLLSETRPTGPQIQSYLHEIQNPAKRAAELGGHLSAFSRDEGGEGKVLDLNGLVLDLDRMLRRLIVEDIELVTLTTGHPAPVRADADQIKLALAVLATGARDSMPRGGKLVIETDEVAIDAERAASHPEVAAGEYVVLSVTEAGPDPYPSETTDLRAGIGQDIVAQGGGYVAVDRQPGRGTTFRLYLPKVDDGDIPGAPDDESDPWAAGTETVLLAEDEPAVRETAHRVLHEQGYTVLDAANGHDALGVAREHAGEEIALLLTDVVMPLMGGRELAERLAYLHPEARVLYTSGYADATTARYGPGNEGIEFMPKPFTPAELARKVREVLDA